MNSIYKYWVDWINNKNKDNCNLGEDIKKGIVSGKISVDDIVNITNILNEPYRKMREQEQRDILPCTQECKYGHEDCIHDPAYQRYYYPKDDCGDCEGCVDSCWYDDEDK